MFIGCSGLKVKKNLMNCTYEFLTSASLYGMIHELLNYDIIAIVDG